MLIKKILQGILGIIIFMFGLWGIYRVSGWLFQPSSNFFTEQERTDIKEFRRIALALEKPPDATMKSSNIVTRNYNRGYFSVFTAKSNINDVLYFYNKKLIDEGYNVRVYSNSKKIRAVKENRVVVIKEELTERNVCQYSIYIKPNDIFEWRSLDLYFLE